MSNCLGPAVSNVGYYLLDPTVSCTSPHDPFRLDVFQPSGGAPKGVTLVYFHGGGWVAGDKGNVRDVNLACTLAGMGYHVVSANYYLACNGGSAAPVRSKASFPRAVQDAKAAVSWIREVGMDPQGLALPTTLIALGDSAGGHVAALMAMTDGVDMLEPLPPPSGGGQLQPGTAYGADYRVDGVVAFSPPVDLFSSGCDPYDILDASLAKIECQTACAKSPAVDPTFDIFCSQGFCEQKIPCGEVQPDGKSYAGWCAGYAPPDGSTSPVERFLGEEWDAEEVGLCSNPPALNQWSGNPFVDATVQHWVDPCDPPFFGFVAELDGTVPGIHTPRLVNALTSLVPPVYARRETKTVAEGCGHAWQALFSLPASMPPQPTCFWDPSGLGNDQQDAWVVAALNVDLAVQNLLLHPTPPCR